MLSAALLCFFYPSDSLVDLKSQNMALVTFLRLFVRVDSMYSQTAVFLKVTSGSNVTDGCPVAPVLLVVSLLIVVSLVRLLVLLQL